MKRSGFTLIEMLVVLGIIAILAGATLGGVTAVRKKAQRAKAQDLVSNCATALTAVLQLTNNWPGYLIAAASQGDPILDEKGCQPLAEHGVYSLSYVRQKDADGYTYYKLKGQDRCGVADPWATAFLRRLDPTMSGDSALSMKVSGAGGTVKDHLLRFAVDEDYDGITEARVAGETIRVRASAVVWGAGQDGKFERYDRAGRSDDVYSWQRSQVQR